MQPVAVMVSFRLGGADGVAVEARKWEWALHELGFHVRRVAGEFDDGLRPDDTWLPFLAIDPVDGQHARSRRAERRARRRRPRGRREPLLAPDQPRRVDARPRTCSPSTTGRWCSTTTTCRGNAPDSPPLPASRRTGPTRCTSPSTTTRAMQLEHRGFDAVTVRNTFDLDPPRGDRDATRVPRSASRPTTSCSCSPRARSRARTCPPPSSSPPSSPRSKRRTVRLWITGPAEDGYDDRVRAHPRRRDDPRHRRSRAVGRRTRTPPPTSSSSRRRGRASATRSSSRSRTGARSPSGTTRCSTSSARSASSCSRSTTPAGAQAWLARPATRTCSRQTSSACGRTAPSPTFPSASHGEFARVGWDAW